MTSGSPRLGRVPLRFIALVALAVCQSILAQSHDALIHPRSAAEEIEATLSAPLDVESVGDMSSGENLETTVDKSMNLTAGIEPLGERTISPHGGGTQRAGSVKVVADGPAGGVQRGADLESLLDGVAEIAAPGVPGLLCVYGPEAFPVIVGGTGGARAPVIAAGRWQADRIVALGHDGYLERTALDRADTGRMMTNVLRWAAGGGGRPVHASAS